MFGHREHFFTCCKDLGSIVAYNDNKDGYRSNWAITYVAQLARARAMIDF
jgi:hypothetical protein